MPCYYHRYPLHVVPPPPSDPLIMQNGRDLVEMCCIAYESPDESGRGDIGAARHVLTGGFGASNDADKSAEEADGDDNAEGYDYCAYHVQPPIHTHTHTRTHVYAQTNI